MSAPAYRGRFAPSPTGDLHLGSLVAALGSWLRARAAGGAWVVRVEDIDPPREVAGSAARIIETLARFGMTSDEPVLYQSTRGDAYEAALERLRASGDAFACACSRKTLEMLGGMHRGACIADPATPGAAIAWRMRAPEHAVGFVDFACGAQSQDLAREVGDYVLKRADGWHAYQLAVVVDDAAQGITEVVRGADLLDSTPRQIHLQRRLGLPTPAYLHLPLVVDAEGKKLSKQLRSVPVDGADPLPALRSALAHLGVEVEGRRVDEVLARATTAFVVGGYNPRRGKNRSAHQGGTS